MNCKVSVVIPSYGDNTNPCRAIDSVLAQDYQNVEVVVVDDNGIGTPQQLKNETLFRKYADNSKVKYIKHEVNKGGSAARNTGARASSGEYLCFLDDDDEFSDIKKIRLQMQSAENLDDTWAGTYSSLAVYKDGKFFDIYKAGPSGYIVEEMIRGNLSIGTGAPIITRKSYESIDGFNESFIRHQDWEFFARLFDKYKMMAVPETLYNRYYKPNVKRVSAKIRNEYMDNYAFHMKREIKSIPKKKLNNLMKTKYSGVVLSYASEKKFCDALNLCKKQHFNVCDYAQLFLSAIIVAFEKLRWKLRKGGKII